MFTQPLIGNYGVPSAQRDEHGLLCYYESPHIQASGVVVADAAEQYSHWTAVQSLGEWCKKEVSNNLFSLSIVNSFCFLLLFSFCSCSIILFSNFSIIFNTLSSISLSLFIL